MGVDDSTR